MKLISVIVVVKNGERFLGRAIESILRQNYSHLEIILVDGQSSDRTADIARGFPEAHYVLQKSGRLGAARNLGLEHAHGEWIAFLDHDDWWPDDKLAKQAAALEDNPDLDYVVGLVKINHPAKPPQTKTGYTPGALLTNKSLFTEAGTFDDSYRIGCDHEWFARVLLQKRKHQVLNHVVLHKQIHGQNLSLHAQVYSQESLRLIRERLQANHDIT
jgi:glycosyltransferase involved in cell wall biosynthesis